MARIATFLALLALAACGRPSTLTGVPSATGPLRTACLEGGREDASDALCGCVQAVADAKLSRRDQRAGVSFFEEPQRAQDMRTSDVPADEAFWKRWRAFGSEAETVCAPAA